MRGAQALLLLCLVVGLAVVVYACRAQLSDLEDSEWEAARRRMVFDLEAEASMMATVLTEKLDAAEIHAIYDAGGKLLRPAPPTQARPFESPVHSVALVLIGQGKLDEAERAATTSAERVRVLLAKGDEASLDLALAEPAMAGTDLSYLVRKRRFELRGEEPDADWLDDVNALLDGPSDRFARTLLPPGRGWRVSSPRERHRLASITPTPGITIDRDEEEVVRVTAEGDRLVMRRVQFHVNVRGEIEAPMPSPYRMLVRAGRINSEGVEARLVDQRPRVILLYVGVALLLMVGTIYAFLAIGRASRLSAAKTDFVANVTHELKTPIANIRLYAESLRAGRVRPEDEAEFLDTILDEGQRLESLVEGLLYAARGAKLEMRPIDPAALLRETESRWRPRLEKEGFALEARVPDLPPVRGDRDALLRALDNLLDNARKYGREDPRIELSGRADNGHVMLVVRDHGAGIPVGERKRVLRPFTRLESADRKETPGTGLGLSLVVSTMEAHAGSVKLAKGAGGGTEVTLVLPTDGGERTT